MPAAQATEWIRSRLAYGPLPPLAGAHDGEPDGPALVPAPGAAATARLSAASARQVATR